MFYGFKALSHLTLDFVSLMCSFNPALIVLAFLVSLIVLCLKSSYDLFIDSARSEATGLDSGYG